ncbi:MAG: hypothetical protein K9L32_04455 [Chromatiaceae bacterium]|nr:hypothetical protein [Chromatiaceae bacterium]
MTTLSKQTARALLRVVQSSDEGFTASKTLRQFSADYGIGRNKGARLLFDAEDKAHVREFLRAEGIDPATKPAAWDPLTRAQALELGPDEKFASRPVKRDRVAIKALAQRPLRMAGERLRLPPACHLDIDGPMSAALLEHETALLVENWECFNRIDAIDLDLSPAGDDPIVIWRGDGSDTRAGQALALLRALDIPVWAFVDYDPAGLLIAERLPQLAGIITPESLRLEEDLGRGLTDRYQAQLPMAAAVLDGSHQEPVRRLWAIVRRHGRALPQERYVRLPTT